MMRALLILAALLVASPAFAGRNVAEWNPPARYDHAFTGKLTVHYLSQKQVVKACSRLFAKYNVAERAALTAKGCAATTSKGACTVILIDRPYKGVTPKAVLRHELGHCNGWQAHHPD